MSSLQPPFYLQALGLEKIGNRSQLNGISAADPGGKVERGLMRDEAIYYMQSAFNNRTIAVVGVYQTAAAAIALANLVTFPEEVSADALHAAAGLLADLVQTAADASDYGLSQDAVWSVSEAVGRLMDANSYALDALTAADYTPPPPYPPEPPSPITPPPPPPNPWPPLLSAQSGSGEVGSGSVEVGSGPSYYIGSPYPHNATAPL